MKKYEYNFKEVEVKAGFTLKYKEHRDIIKRCGEHGFRYVGFVPVENGWYGGVYKMDLVFEREIED